MTLAAATNPTVGTSGLLRRRAGGKSPEGERAEGGSSLAEDLKVVGASRAEEAPQIAGGSLSAEEQPAGDRQLGADPEEVDLVRRWAAALLRSSVAPRRCCS